MKLQYKRLLGGPLRHKRHFYTDEQKQSVFLSEFVKLFNKKSKSIANPNALLQGYIKESDENEQVESHTSTMTPLKVFEKLNNEGLFGYFKAIIPHFDMEYVVQKCEDGHAPKEARYYQNNITVPIIIPDVSLSIPENRHHLSRYGTVKDQVESFFSEKSSEFVKCEYQNCEKRQLKTTIRNVTVLPSEGFIVKPSKLDKNLIGLDDDYLDLGGKDIKLKDEEGDETFVPVSGIREEFGYYVTYVKKDDTWWKFSNALNSPELVEEQELGFCDYICYTHKSLVPDSKLSETESSE